MKATLALSKLASIAALLVGTATASAQGFNVDFNRFTTPQTPASTYAAAGTAGVWNSVMALSGPAPLVDKTGAATGVTLTLGPNLTNDFYYDNLHTSAGDGDLLDDFFFTNGLGTVHPITFAGLANGTYEVYTYAMAPDSKLSFITDVDVVGSPSGVQAVGGFLFTGHAPGVTYARHTVDVTNGRITIQLSIHTLDLTVNGIQLEPAGSAGTAYCFGDGGGGACPCGNPGGPGEGCAHSGGVGATLSTSGSNSVAVDDLGFHAIQLPPNQPALLFSALNQVNAGAGVIFGDGLRCAGGSLTRLAVAAADAGGTVSWGSGFAASGGWVGGDTRRFQAWYRDPVGSPCGAGYNLTQGFEIVFTP